MQVMSLPISMERTGDDKLMIFLLVWTASSMIGLCSNARQFEEIASRLETADHRTRSSLDYLLKACVSLEERNQKARNSDGSHSEISTPLAFGKELHEFCSDLGKNSKRPLALVGHFNQAMRNFGDTCFTISNVSTLFDFIQHSIRPLVSAQYFCKTATMSMMACMSPMREYKARNEIDEASNALWEDSWGKTFEAIRKLLFQDHSTDWLSKVVSTAPVENLIKDLIKNSLPLPVEIRVECWLATTFSSKLLDGNTASFSLKSIQEEPLENQFEDCPVNGVQGESPEDHDGNFSKKSLNDQALEDYIESSPPTSMDEPLGHIHGICPLESVQAEPLDDRTTSYPVNSTLDFAVENHFGKFSSRKSDQLPKHWSMNDLTEGNLEERRLSSGYGSSHSVVSPKKESMQHSLDCKRVPELPLPLPCTCFVLTSDPNPDFHAPCIRDDISESSSVALFEFQNPDVDFQTISGLSSMEPLVSQKCDVDLPKNSSLYDQVEDWARCVTTKNANFTSESLFADDPMNHGPDCKRLANLPLPLPCTCFGSSGDPNPDFQAPSIEKTTSESLSKALLAYDVNLPENSSLNDLVEDWKRWVSPECMISSSEYLSDEESMSPKTACKRFRKLPLPCTSVGSPSDSGFGEPCTPKRKKSASESSLMPPISSPDSGLGSSPKGSRPPYTEQYPSKKKCSSCPHVEEESKFFERRLYGLLMNCSHVFCYPCISKYSKFTRSPMIKSAVCPECGVKSEVVAASSTWKEGYEKERFFREFLGEMQLVAKSTDHCIAAKNSEDRARRRRVEAAKRRLFPDVSGHAVAT